MKFHRLLAILAGVILAILAATIIVLWVTGGLNSTFALYSLAILAALGAVLRLWFVNREESELHDEHR